MRARPWRSRLPRAIVVAVATAGAATFLLRPRGGVVEPARVDVQAYFTAAELDRARAYRRVQRRIGVAGIALGGGTLVLLARRPPRRLLEPLERRPVAGGATAAAGLSLVLVAVGLPLSAWSHRRAVDVGLSTQGWPAWLGDVGKSTAIEAGFAAAGGALGLALMRRFGRRWWIAAAAAGVGFGVAAIWLFPVVIDPVFNDFEPLPEGQTRSEVLELARRAGVDVGEVFEVDASRRTTAANAYVNGLGQTKRVVLFDTLLRDFPGEEVRIVVAHELAHQRHRDIYRGLAWLALVAPAGSYLVQRLAETLGRREGLDEPGPADLPAVALAAALVGAVLGPASNAMSRRVEAAADAFALRLTEEPAAFVEMQRRLAVRNLADPDPPRLSRILFGTHPTTAERIGMGEALRGRQ
jgi:Zn-dependent protease with chaperone function